MFDFKFLRITFIGIGSLCLINCAKQAPHLGDSVSQTDLGEGVSITQADSRRLLPSGKIAGLDSALAEVQSTVDLIDYKTRKIVLSRPGQEPIMLVASPEIRNFNQIQAGDKVKVEYLLSVAFEVRKPTAEEIKAAASKEGVQIDARAKLGEKPAIASAKGQISIASVESINKESGSITLKDTESGNVAEVMARYPENLNYVKTGDSVVITAVEATAISVAKVS